MDQQIYRITDPNFIAAMWVFLELHNLDIIFAEYQTVRALYTAIPRGDIDAEFFIRFSKHVTPVITTSEWSTLPKI